MSLYAIKSPGDSEEPGLAGNRRTCAVQIFICMRQDSNQISLQRRGHFGSIDYLSDQFSCLFLFRCIWSVWDQLELLSHRACLKFKNLKCSSDLDLWSNQKPVSVLIEIWMELHIFNWSSLTVISSSRCNTSCPEIARPRNQCTPRQTGWRMPSVTRLLKCTLKHRDPNFQITLIVALIPCQLLTFLRNRSC